MSENSTTLKMARRTHRIYVKSRSISGQNQLDVSDSFLTLTIGIEFSDRPIRKVGLALRRIGSNDRIREGG